MVNQQRGETQHSTVHRNAVVGLGEVLWDVFPDGARFGGAPANFACTFSGLRLNDHEVGMISAVGHDRLGEQALEQLQHKGVLTTWVAQVDRATGTVQVEIDDRGSASYSFAEDTAWDSLSWSESLSTLTAHVRAVCFGTLGQREAKSQETIRRFLDEVDDPCLRVFDVNLRPPYWNDEVLLESLRRSDVVKLNEDELPILQDCCQVAGDKEQAMHKLVEKFSLKLIGLTEGSQGATLVSATGEVNHHPGVAAEIVDTVGAGDAFTATLVAGLLAEMPLGKINAWAADVAAYVCSQPGATPALPNHLRFKAQA